MNWLTAPAPAWTTSTGLLVIRVAIGAAFILHGIPKIQDPTGWMNAMGNPPPAFLQAAAAVIEVGGGALLVLGLLGRVAASLLVAQMIAALALVHIPHGDPFVGTPGRSSAELAVAYLAVSLLLAVTGPGQWSLDAMLFGMRSEAAKEKRIPGPAPAFTSP